MPTEKEIADQWLSQHEHLLPHMSDGERINYDPIIYFPPDESWRLKALEIKKYEESLNLFTPIEERNRAVFLALFIKTLTATNLTVLQAICLLMQTAGFTQEKIGKTLGISQQTAAQHLSFAKKKIQVCHQS